MAEEGGAKIEVASSGLSIQDLKTRAEELKARDKVATTQPPSVDTEILAKSIGAEVGKVMSEKVGTADTLGVTATVFGAGAALLDEAGELTDKLIRPGLRGERNEEPGRETEGEDISTYSYKKIREALDSRKLRGKELTEDKKDELSMARRERYKEAEQLGVFDGARKALVETLIESEWKQSDYITKIDGLAQRLEDQARMVRGYRGNPKLEGVVGDAVRATHLLARFDGLIHASDNAIAKGLKVDRETLDQLANQIRDEVLWNPEIPKSGYKAYIDQLTPAQAEKKREEQSKTEERRRQDDAEKRATDHAQQLLEATKDQTQKLRALEEKLADLRRGEDDVATRAVERQIAGLRQDMAAGRQTETGNSTTAILDALRKTMSGEISDEAFPTREAEWGDWMRHRLDIIERSTAMATELVNQGAFNQSGKALAEVLKALNERKIPREAVEETRARLRLYASWAAINRVGWNVDPSKGATIEAAAQEISLTTNYWSEWGGIRGDDIKTLLSDQKIKDCWDLLQGDVSKTEPELASSIGNGPDSLAKAKIAKRLFRATFEESIAKGRQLLEDDPRWEDDGGDKGARCYYLDQWLLIKKQGPEATRKSGLIKGFGTSYLGHLDGSDYTSREIKSGDNILSFSLTEGEMRYEKFLEDRVSQYMVALGILMRKDFSVAEAADDKLDPWWTAFGKAIKAADPDKEDPDKKLRLGFYWLLGSRVGMSTDNGSETRDRAWQLKWEPFINAAIQKGFVEKRDKKLFRPGLEIALALIALALKANN